MEKIILGSASPKRAEILEYFAIPFKQVPSHFDERAICFKNNPTDYCRTIAECKANVLKDKFSEDVILTADSITYREGKIYNKPENAEEAFNFLTELSGKWHSVFTGICLQKGDLKYSATEETRLLFNELSPKQIKSYLQNVDYSNKCGATTIEGGAGLLLARLEGCYYNVLGLPINTFRKLLLKMDIDLWDFLRKI